MPGSRRQSYRGPTGASSRFSRRSPGEASDAMRLEAYLVGAAAEECRHVEVLLRGLFARRAGRGGRRRAGGAGGIARRLSLPSTLPGGHVELVLSASRGASLRARRTLTRVDVLAEAGRDHRDPDLVAHRLVDDGAEMMLASSSASSWMSEAASFTSWRD